MRDVPQRSIKRIARKSPHSSCAEWSCGPGLLTAGETDSACPVMHGSSGNVELTFLGHPLKSFGRAFDPVLAVIPVGRKQPDHLIGAAGGRTRDIAGSKVNGLSNGEFVLQRLLPSRKKPAVLTVPLQRPD